MLLMVSYAGAKSVPVHCLIEQVQHTQNTSNSEGHSNNRGSGSSHQQPTAEIDTYAIISASTPFNEIVKTALLKLGYTPSEASGAKGNFPRYLKRIPGMIISITVWNGIWFI